MCIRQHKVVEVARACYRTKRILKGCADWCADPLLRLLRRSAHPISVLELTVTEVDGRGG